MIQRIQSLYMFIVTVLMAVTVFLPFFTIHASDGTELYISFRGLAAEGWHWTATTGCLGILTAVIGLLSLGCIFLFNNRRFQVRILIFNMLLCLGWYALLAIAATHAVAATPAAGWTINVAACFPLVSIILTWLAMRGVLKDEARVRAADRLR